MKNILWIKDLYYWVFKKMVKIHPLNYKYNEYGLISNKSFDFIKDIKYIKSLKAHDELADYPALRWKVHINNWLAFKAIKLKGDFVECGVNRGASARQIVEYIDFKLYPNKRFYLFDTYKGFDKEVSTKKEFEDHKGVYDNTYNFVKESFEDYPNVRIIKGTVPNSLRDVKIDRVAYLSIDMNCAYAEKKALEYFWSKLVHGGVILLDDYGWPGHETQKKVADEFVKKVGTKILYLPTGHGIIIK